MRAKHTVAKGARGLGHAPPGNFFNFKRCTDSLAFWDTFLSW